MPIVLDERAVRDELAPCLADAGFARALQNLVGDRLCLSLFLMGVSHGEALGEAGVAAIGLDDVASLMHDLRRQQLEEHGHMAGTRLVVEELFPEHFARGAYRYAHAIFGREYYLTVREANRQRLRALDRYSRLNLFLTTSFGYEIMVGLLYGAVIDALRTSALPRSLTERVAFVLTVILRQAAPTRPPRLTRLLLTVNLGPGGRRERRVVRGGPGAREGRPPRSARARLASPR